jgi:hypothetical protein
MPWRGLERKELCGGSMEREELSILLRCSSNKEKELSVVSRCSKSLERKEFSMLLRCSSIVKKELFMFTCSRSIVRKELFILRTCPGVQGSEFPREGALHYSDEELGIGGKREK